MRRIIVGVALCVSVPALAAGFECLLEPSQVVELRTSVDGLIEKVHVQRADQIRKGQVLVELESRVERAAVAAARYRSEMRGQIATARSRIAFAEKKFARAEELQREKMVSAQAADEAKAELLLAQAELQAAEENLELARLEYQRAVAQLALRTLQSPFSGVVVERMLNPGDLAESGAGRQPVLKLAQIDPLHVDVVLPSTLFGHVHAGARMAIRLQDSGARHLAKVKFVDRVVDAASGTYVARLELPNPEGKIPSGVRCQADFDPPRENDPKLRP